MWENSCARLTRIIKVLWHYTNLRPSNHSFHLILLWNQERDKMQQVFVMPEKNMCYRTHPELNMGEKKIQQFHLYATYTSLLRCTFWVYLYPALAAPFRLLPMLKREDMKMHMENIRHRAGFSNPPLLDSWQNLILIPVMEWFVWTLPAGPQKCHAPAWEGVWLLSVPGNTKQTVARLPNRVQEKGH